jgi:hypothetical protein
MRKTVVLLAAAALALVFASCETTDMTTNRVGWSDYMDVAVKDFESLGIVSLQTQETVTVSPLHLMTEHRGSRVTYAGLFAEATKLGADDITNVRIDMQTESKKTFIDWLIGYRTVYTYSGTALAIKYIGAIEREKSSNQAGIAVEPE